MNGPAEQRDPLTNNVRFAAYNIPGTNVLQNRLGITDGRMLQDAEYNFTAARSATLPAVRPTAAGFKAVHGHLFQDIYDWAGEFRTANMTLDGTVGFADWSSLESSATRLFNAVALEARQSPATEIEQFGERSARLTGALNRMHPFREGNGRTMRAFLTSWGEKQGFCVDFEYMGRGDWLQASTDAYHQRYETMTELVVAEHPISIQRELDAAAEAGRPSQQRGGRFDHLREPRTPDTGLDLP